MRIESVNDQIFLAEIWREAREKEQEINENKERREVGENEVLRELIYGE